MTYEEFKRELFRNLSIQEKDWDRQIGLLERSRNSYEDRVPQVTDYRNILEQGGTGSRVEDGSLCVRWGTAAGNGKRRNARDGQIFLRMQNYNRNREKLKDCAFLRFGDTALVLCTCMEDVTEPEEGRKYGRIPPGSRVMRNMPTRNMPGAGEEKFVPIPISRRTVIQWHTSMEGVFVNALLNSWALHPPRLFLANDIRLRYDFRDGVFMPGETGGGIPFRTGNFQEGVKGYRLTTTARRDGAIAIFYPGVMERLKVLMRGDYYVGFLGVDEAVIHPVFCKSPSELKASIHHINAVYSDKDTLSERVYRYWSSQKRLLEVY